MDGGDATADAGPQSDAPAVTTDAPETPDGDLPKPTTEAQMFAALGVDTARSPRSYVDRKGGAHTLDDGYNPLGRGVRVLRPLAEIYLAGRGLGGAHANQILVDDFKNQTTPTPLDLTDMAETWTQNTFTHSIAADLDGDGTDEVVNVYWIESSMELHANVVRCTGACTANGGAFTNVKDTRLNVGDSTKKPIDRDWFKHGFAAADVNGDGKQEIVVVNFGGIDVCTATDAAFTCAPQGTPNPSQHMSVARGHFDDNPEKKNDDVVVAWGDGALAYVSIFDGTPSAFAPNAFTSPSHDPQALAIKFIDQQAVLSYSEAYVATGDVDKDGRDEIVLSARRAGTIEHDLVLMDDAGTSYRFFRAFRYPLGPDPGHQWINDSFVFGPNPRNQLFRPALAVFTKRSQPVYEKAIYAASYILDGLDNLLASDAQTLPANTDVMNQVKAESMNYYETGGGGFNHAPSEVVVGDIDGTGKDTVVALWDQVNEETGNRSAFVPATLAKVAWDPGTGKWPRWKNFITTTTGLAPVTGEYDGTYGCGLALPNVDRDSPVVKYDNQHELLFSKPRVLAVLAAAPFFTGKNAANSQTSISFGTGKGYEAESTIGVSASVSIGYEAPNLFGTSKFETKLTFGAAIDWISSSKVALTQTQTWTAGNEDAVVFQVIPFDVYYYKVLSSPDPSDFAKPLTINVPRKVSTYKVPVALYNRSILDGPMIGATLLTHTVGDPASYPKANVCAGAPAGGTFGTTAFVVDPNTWCFASADKSHVGVGTGSVGFAIARTSTSSTGISNDYSVDFEVEAGGGGIIFGASVGFHWGYTYTVDSTQSYSFAGQVGDLPDATHGYDFGLMAHKGVLAGVATTYPIFLVDYWVENVQ